MGWISSQVMTISWNRRKASSLVIREVTKIWDSTSIKECLYIYVYCQILTVYYVSLLRMPDVHICNLYIVNSLCMTVTGSTLCILYSCVWQVYLLTVNCVYSSAWQVCMQYIVYVRYHCGGWSEGLDSRILLLAYIVYL
jgi:hypothetical protein